MMGRIKEEFGNSWISKCGRRQKTIDIYRKEPFPYWDC
jgi:hypothetical protein